MQEVFAFSETKITVPWTYVVSDLNNEEITGKFDQKKLQTPNQEKLRIKKVLKRKGDKLYVKWTFLSRLEILEETLTLNLICLITQQKLIWKKLAHVDTSSFALKTNLACLKTEVDKLNTDKLTPVPVDLSKLSDVLKNDAVKKTEYDKLVPKVNDIDTSDFVLKN